MSMTTKQAVYFAIIQLNNNAQGKSGSYFMLLPYLSRYNRHKQLKSTKKLIFCYFSIILVKIWL